MNGTCTKIVPIVVSPDNNYVIPTYVMLHSLIKYKSSKDNYEIFVLSNELSEENNNLLKSLEEISTGINIRFLSVNDAFSDTEIFLEHTTIATMYRLLLPQILPEHDKCIYIDGDALICSNIAQVFNESLGDNYIAAVKDIEAAQYFKTFPYEITPPAEQYINAGFLLMNLKKMREDCITASFLELSRKKFLFCDQDIINIVCHNKIAILPLKYNAMVKYRFLHYRLKNYKKEVTDCFSLNDIYEAQEYPIMIHYAQPIKPWQCKYVYEGKRWNNYVTQNIDQEINKKHITPYILKSQKDKKTQLNLGIRYLLSKCFFYKHLLRLKNKI